MISHSESFHHSLSHTHTHARTHARTHTYCKKLYCYSRGSMDLTLSQSGGIPKGQADVNTQRVSHACWHDFDIICAPLWPKTNMKNETSKSEVQFKQYRMSNRAVSESFNQITREKTIKKTRIKAYWWNATLNRSYLHRTTSSVQYKA